MVAMETREAEVRPGMEEEEEQEEDEEEEDEEEEEEDNEDEGFPFFTGDWKRREEDVDMFVLLEASAARVVT